MLGIHQSVVRPPLRGNETRIVDGPDQIVLVGSYRKPGRGHDILLDHGAPQIVGPKAEGHLPYLQPLGDP